MTPKNRLIQRVLIANRGEIACRIIRTAKAQGLETVAVYSDADRLSQHVSLADTAVYIGDAAPAQSYLNIEALIQAVNVSQADAVHPGYGFLAENADFAQAVIDNGTLWIGPSPEVIRSMGNKARAKDLMQAAGVACIPGYQGTEQSDAELLIQAQRIGFPLMVKAAAGGGGRGMRLVDSPALLAQALTRARTEAMTAFGSSELILERAVLNARHVEIQIVGDTQGNVLHLGERDCSVQRRHQKLIEEAPSPAVNPQLRARMGAMAVKAAQSIGYVGVGTVECLLGEDGQFYFMEMNTRLQVEHAVTEAITGIDLVAWQFAIAEGQALPISQEEVRFEGHAIEVRLTAEDVPAGFLPQSGTVTRFCSPGTLPGIRVDHCLADGVEVSPYYDSMIAKVIAVGADRGQAIRRLTSALNHLVVLGLPTNQHFLRQCLRHPVFAEGNARTDFVERYREHILDDVAEPTSQCLAVAALACTGLITQGTAQRAAPFETRLASLETTVRLKERAGEWQVVIRADQDQALWTRIIKVAPKKQADHLTAPPTQPEWQRWNPVWQNTTLSVSGQRVEVFDGGRAWSFECIDPLTGQSTKQLSGALRAPLGAKLTSVTVCAGERVVAGQVLAVLEAMKMEHAIMAPFDGVIQHLMVKQGDQVRVGAHLLQVEPVSAV